MGYRAFAGSGVRAASATIPQRGVAYGTCGLIEYLRSTGWRPGFHRLYRAGSRCVCVPSDSWARRKAWRAAG